MNGKKILDVLTHTLSTTTTATGGFGDDDMTAEGQTSSGVFWFSFFLFFFLRRLRCPKLAACRNPLKMRLVAGAGDP